MMSTPAATSVESVREKRASAIFWTTSPIFIGILQLEAVPALAALLACASASAARRCAPIMAGKMMNQ